MACGFESMPMFSQTATSAAAIRSAAFVSCSAAPMPRAAPMTIRTCQLIELRAIVPVTQRVTTIAMAHPKAASTGGMGVNVSMTMSAPRIERASHARSCRMGRVPSTDETR